MERRIETEAGVLRLVVRGGELVYCGWDTEDCERKYRRLGDEGLEVRDEGLGIGDGDEGVMEEVVRELEEYFRGGRREFDFPVKIVGGSEFQRRVWEAMREIPYGEVETYGELAKRCGCPGGARAVAGACGANPLSIVIPCHRVVGTNGLGGYTGGRDKKEWLLGRECIIHNS